MWRASQKLSVIQNVRPRQTLRTGCRRISTKPALRSANNPNYPPPPKRSGDMGILNKFFTMVGMGVGGALFYTWYEPEFRTKVEMNILFAREVLHFFDKFIPRRSQILDKKEMPQIPWFNGPQSGGEKKPAPGNTQAPSKLVVTKPAQTSPAPAVPDKAAEEKAAADKAAAAMETEKQRLKTEKKQKEKDDLAQNQGI